jgi:hypothetical protein
MPADHPTDHAGKRVYLKKVALKNLASSRYAWEYAQVCELPQQCTVLAFIICKQIVWTVLRRSAESQQQQLWRLVPMYEKNRNGFVALHANTHTRTAEHHASSVEHRTKLLELWPGAQALLNGFPDTGDTRADLQELSRLGHTAPASMFVVFPLQDLGTSVPYWWPQHQHAPANLLQHSTGDDSCSGRDGMNAECDGKMDPVTLEPIETGRGCCVRSPLVGRSRPGTCFTWLADASIDETDQARMGPLHRAVLERRRHPATNKHFTVAQAFENCKLHAQETKPARAQKAKKARRYGREF